jgi:hypothetical protein
MRSEVEVSSSSLRSSRLDWPWHGMDKSRTRLAHAHQIIKLGIEATSLQRPRCLKEKLDVV